MQTRSIGQIMLTGAIAGLVGGLVVLGGLALCPESDAWAQSSKRRPGLGARPEKPAKRKTPGATSPPKGSADSVTAKEIRATHKLTSEGPAEMYSSLKVKRDTNMEGSLTVRGNVDVQGKLKFKSSEYSCSDHIDDNKPRTCDLGEHNVCFLISNFDECIKLSKKSNGHWEATAKADRPSYGHGGTCNVVCW